MKLDRYNNKRPRYLVFRRMEKGEEWPSPHTALYPGPDGWLYKPVDPNDCFVLKRQDALATAALEHYARKAEVEQDEELARDVERLASEWRETHNRKMPD